jgi:hypothetical protein
LIFEYDQKLVDAKRKNQKNTKNITKSNKNRILITCSPATAPKKGACYNI